MTCIHAAEPPSVPIVATAMLTKFRRLFEYVEENSKYPIRAIIYQNSSREAPNHFAANALILVYGRTAMRVSYSDACGLMVEHNPEMITLMNFDLDAIMDTDLDGDLGEVLVFLERCWEKYDVLVPSMQKEQYLAAIRKQSELKPFPGETNPHAHDDDSVIPFVEQVFGAHAVKPTKMQNGGSTGMGINIFEYIDLGFIWWNQDRTTGWNYYEPVVYRYERVFPYRYDYSATRNDMRILAQLLDIRDWALSFLPEDYLERQFQVYGPLPDVSDARTAVEKYLMNQK